MDVGQILTLLLGGGATATVIAVFNGVKALREGSTKREQDTVAGLIARREEAETSRKEAVAERAYAEDERDWWRTYAGALEYQLVLEGYRDALPAKPAPLPPYVPPVTPTPGATP